MRREWIEMSPYGVETVSLEPSPSMRREWIEMKHRLRASELLASPSMRREWIEIRFFAVKSIIQTGLPPCGGSGLKSLDGLAESINETVSLHAEGVD